MDDFSPITTETGKRFITHLSAVNSNIPLEKALVLWHNIAERYNENQRAYHTLQHIQQLFEQFEQVKQYLFEPHIIALALFYHDVIYEPTRSDNEFKSAEYAVVSLTRYLNTEQCKHIYALIMMTASHQLDNLLNKNKVSDAAYLLDMDLSVLGAPRTDYEKYAQAVRQEYAHVSDTEYCTGRALVLNSLLTHPTLYLTDYYYSRLEEQARANIKREIILLRAS